MEVGRETRDVALAQWLKVEESNGEGQFECNKAAVKKRKANNPLCYGG